MNEKISSGEVCQSWLESAHQLPPASYHHHPHRSRFAPQPRLSRRGAFRVRSAARHARCGHALWAISGLCSPSTSGRRVSTQNGRAHGEGVREAVSESKATFRSAGTAVVGGLARAPSRRSSASAPLPLTEFVDPRPDGPRRSPVRRRRRPAVAQEGLLDGVVSQVEGTAPGGGHPAASRGGSRFRDRRPHVRMF